MSIDFNKEPFFSRSVSPLFSTPPSSSELLPGNSEESWSESPIFSRAPSPSEFILSEGYISNEPLKSPTYYKVNEMLKNGCRYLDVYETELKCPKPTHYVKKRCEMNQAFRKIREKETFFGQGTWRGNYKDGFVYADNFEIQKEYYNILETIARIKKTYPDEDSSLINSILQKEILQKNRDGKTPLHLAAELGDTKAIVQMLDFLTNKDIETGLQRKDNLGQTPFHLAMLHSKGGSTLRALLDALKEDKRATPLLVYDEYGKTALHYLSDSQQLMLDPQNYMSRKLTAIFQKIRNPLDRYDLLEAMDKKGRTPLHYAAMGVDTGVLKTMIDITSDENLYQIDNEGKTFFHYMLIGKRLFSLEPQVYSNNLADPANPTNILSKRDDEFLKNIENLLSRIKAISENELIRFINIQDKDGKTALYYAASSHYGIRPFLDCLKKVLPSYKKTVCLTSFIDEVDTLFHFLARQKHLTRFFEVLKLLSDDDREYLIMMPNLRGETIFDILIERGFEKSYYTGKKRPNIWCANTRIEVIAKILKLCPKEKRAKISQRLFEKNGTIPTGKGDEYFFSAESRFDVIAIILRLFSEENRVKIATRFDKRGETLFHRASYNTDPKALSTLLEVIHPKDRAYCLKIQEEAKKNTPLHYAAGIQEAEQILNNVLMMVPEDDRAYCVAMQNEKEEDVLFLLLHHPTDASLALIVPDIIQLLPEDERVPLLTRKDSHEESLIHDIAYQEDPNVLFNTLNALSKKEVASCLKFQDKYLNTPLHLLAKNGDFQSILSSLKFIDREDRLSCFRITNNKNDNMFSYELKYNCPQEIQKEIYKLLYIYA
ncbi:MAG: hypothetical protein K940chlam1_00008 [Candidatus Anoxychlamydiales bacterium]|nr:hypothetical protein [Candidatus Anoxychlamydiales bacterium]NGX35825.1 hypothetical protein [Candidatus Anoxychlamydiales bacterium]